VLTNLINRHLYSQIPLLANQVPVTFTDKFHYLHFPPLSLLLPNSITLKFHTPLEIIHRVSEKNWTLCYFIISLLWQLRIAWKFPEVHRRCYLLWILNTLKHGILYLQISTLANSKTTGLQPNSGTCKFHYLQIHTTRIDLHWIDTRIWVRGTTHSFYAANLFMPPPPKKPYSVHCSRHWG